MSLLPGWQNRLYEASSAVSKPLAAVSLDPARASADLRVIETADDGRRFLHDLRATPLSAIALSFHHAAQDGPCGDARFNPPAWASVAAWAQSRAQGQPGAAVCGVLRIRDAGVIGDLLRLRVPVVVHDAKPALLALWAHGLDPVLPQLFDTHLAAACLHLGSHHPRARRGRRDEGERERIGVEQRLIEEKAALLSLEGQCAHYGLPVPFSAQPSPKALASRAEATLRLYVAQQPDFVRAGLLHHLHTVEFPFAVANARMEWRGVHVEPERSAALTQGCRRAVDRLSHELRAHGVDPPGSFDALLAALRRSGVEPLPAAADDGALKAVEHGHPAVRAFRRRRHYAALVGTDWRCGPDGRVHPEHVQLAAATGRNACRNPALAGIGRALRPVVTAPPGRALVEQDYSQIEVGVAAAEHEDPDLIAAYNAGDVYASAAQRFYGDDLSDEERALAPAEFKRRRPELREGMKTFVLASIYNAGPKTLAAQFGISVAEAERRQRRFLSLYPKLAEGLARDAEYGASRGYASIVSGLRRETNAHAPDGWQRNWLRNTPIQGGAAVVFKRALIDLDRAFRGTSTWLVMQVYDSVLIECELCEVRAVADRAAQIMRDAVRSLYPVLDPHIDVNRSRPHCWNKDGDAGSLDRFLAAQQFAWLPEHDDVSAWAGLARWFIEAEGAALLVRERGVA